MLRLSMTKGCIADATFFCVIFLKFWNIERICYLCNLKPNLNEESTIFFVDANSGTCVVTDATGGDG